MSTETGNRSGMNRRQFIAVSSGAALALLLHQGMANVSVVHADQKFIESTCGQDGKAQARVLIAYASRCGSTGTIAAAMAEALCALGASVDVRLVKNVKDLSRYQAVIVGSAIRRSKWLSEAADFVRTNQDALSRVPTAYFVACLTMKVDTPENRAKVMAYLDPVWRDAPKVKPVAVGLFPGVVDFSKLSFFTSAMLQAKGIEEGDYRNLPAVKRWASEAGPGLLAARQRG
jgi:menaquinone-dependent protoporphyrinogen oxidase